MRNKRRVTALTVIAVAAIIAAGGLMASNMGFKLNYPLLAATPGQSATGFQTIGLPYYRQVGIDTAAGLLGDITAGGVNAVALQKFNPALDSLDGYPVDIPDYPLTPGEGYFLQVTNSGPYIIVGSHNPAQQIIWTPSGGGSATGFHFYAHPYHGVASMAAAFLAETGAIAIQKFNPALDSLDGYPVDIPDFPLVPGQAYFVQSNSANTFSPAHY